MSYWLWMGSLLPEPAAIRRPAVSLAANRWQHDLLEALAIAGQKVYLLSHVPEPAWPRGRMFVVAEKPGEGWEGMSDAIGYPNLPRIRWWWLNAAHTARVRNVIRRMGLPSACLTYNLQEAYAGAAARLQREHGVPWIPVIADVPDRRGARAVYESRLSEARARVYLSWKLFQESTSREKLHLDGGIRAMRPASQATSRAFLYTGAMNRYGGVDVLVDAFRRLPNGDAELWICGKGTNAAVTAAAREDRRIKVFGAVPESRLEDLSNAALAFVNPRPALEANSRNFPSKVLEYLSYGKPVISTWTDGLAPEYRQVLLVADDQGPDALCRKMSEVLRWPPEKMLNEFLKNRQFLELNKLWLKQACGLIEWFYLMSATKTNNRSCSHEQ